MASVFSIDRRNGDIFRCRPAVDLDWLGRLHSGHRSIRIVVRAGETNARQAPAISDYRRISDRRTWRVSLVGVLCCSVQRILDRSRQDVSRRGRRVLSPNGGSVIPVRGPTARVSAHAFSTSRYGCLSTTQGSPYSLYCCRGPQLSRFSIRDGLRYRSAYGAQPDRNESPVWRMAVRRLADAGSLSWSLSVHYREGFGYP